MTSTTIENEAISIQLSDTESVTVPTGEVWKVTITGRSASLARDDSDGGVYIKRFCKINGSIVASSESNSDAWTGGSIGANATANASSTFPFDTVLVGGDRIKSEDADLNVSGFVVN